MPRNRSRSPGDSDRHDAHGRKRFEGGANDVVSIPTSAPRLAVPANLPVNLTTFLDIVASKVAQGGLPLEDELRRREKDNPYFSFLTAPWNDQVAVYYRWRLYSLMQGDTLTSWRTEPFQMQSGAHQHVVIPPPIPSGLEVNCEIATVAPASSSGEAPTTKTKKLLGSHLYQPVPPSFGTIAKSMTDDALHDVSAKQYLSYQSGAYQPLPETAPAEQTKEWKNLIQTGWRTGVGRARGEAPASGSRPVSPVPSFSGESPTLATSPTAPTTAPTPQEAVEALVKSLPQIRHDSESKLQHSVIEARSKFMASNAAHLPHLLSLLLDEAVLLSFAALPDGDVTEAQQRDFVAAVSADMLSLLFTLHDVAMNAEVAEGPLVLATSGESAMTTQQRAQEVPYSDVARASIKAISSPLFDAVWRLVANAAGCERPSSADGPARDSGLLSPPTSTPAAISPPPPPESPAAAFTVGDGGALEPLRVLVSWVGELVPQWRDAKALSVRKTIEVLNGISIITGSQSRAS